MENNKKAVQNGEKVLKQVSKELQTALDEKMGGNVSKLARESGVTNITISNILAAKNINPSLAVLNKIFSAMGLQLVFSVKE